MYSKCFCGRGCAPNPAEGARSTPPDPLAGFRGPLRDREGRGTERERTGSRGGNRRESRGTDEGEGERGREVRRKEERGWSWGD